MKPISKKSLLIPTLTLFTSMSTLLCCALPALLVALGAGAAMAGLITNLPGLVWLSSNKPMVFGVSGVLITLSALLWWRSRRSPCPADVDQARACVRVRLINGYMILGAAIIYAIGATVAFIIPLVY